MQYLIEASLPVMIIGMACLLGGLSAAWVSALLAGDVPRDWRLTVSMIVTASIVCTCAIVWRPDQFAWSLLLGWSLMVLAGVDCLILRLPDLLTIPLIAAGLIQSRFQDNNWTDHVAGVVIGYAVIAATGWVFERWRGKRGIGLGDAKLFAAAGAWLGWEALPAVMLISCAIGLTGFAIMALRRGREALATPAPFGLPLCCGVWIVWLLAQTQS